MSFPAKTSYLHTWRDHHHYGYIINHAFESKLLWCFTGVYIINRILHTRLWIWILSSCVQLDISLFTALSREISSWPLEDKIHIHVQACNNLYILFSDKLLYAWPTVLQCKFQKPHIRFFFAIIIFDPLQN